MIRSELTGLVETVVLRSVAADKTDAGARLLAFPWFPDDDKRLKLDGLRVEEISLAGEGRSLRVDVVAGTADLAAWALEQRELEAGT